MSLTSPFPTGRTVENEPVTTPFTKGKKYLFKTLDIMSNVSSGFHMIIFFFFRYTFYLFQSYFYIAIIT